MFELSVLFPALSGVPERFGRAASLDGGEV